jgi:hypothetical protein
MDVIRIALASVLLVGAVISVPPAWASVTTPAKSLRTLNGRPLWVPICSRRGVNGSAAYTDSTNTAAMDQVLCTAPSWGKVTALKLVYAGFDLPQMGEQDRLISATITAAIFQPANNQYAIASSAATSFPSSTLQFAGGSFNSNALSIGQQISGTGIPAGDYVTGISRVVGTSNAISTVSITLALPTTANTASGQLFTFAGQFTPVAFGGIRSVALTPRHDVLTSDPAAVQVAAGGQFWVRTAASFSGTGIMLMDYPGTGSRVLANTAYGITYDEFDTRGTTLNDLTMAPVSGSNTGGGYFCPWYVLGLVTPNVGAAVPGAVLVLGDSIGAGTGDLADGLYLQGYIQRSLENNIPFITAARGSTTAQMLVARGDGQYAATIDTGVTDVLVELGRNDIQQFSATAAMVEGYTASIAARYGAAGMRVWCFTVPPTTYSNDGWTTLANQGFPMTNQTTSAVTASGSNTIGITTPLAAPVVGQTVDVSPTAQLLSTAVSAGATSLTLISASGLSVGQAVYGPSIASGTTITSVSGSVIGLSAATTGSMSANMSLTFGTGIAPGTTISGYSANVISLSKPTIASIAASTTLLTGTQAASASGVETQRQAFNSYLRTVAGRAALGCSGLVDVDSVFADQAGSGKWRVDLGPASVDGVHPGAALHQAVVNAGIINAGMFPAQ